MRDCEIYGSGAMWQMNETNHTPTVVLTNNVFYRVPFAVNSKATITSVNNLFYGTTNVNVTQHNGVDTSLWRIVVEHKPKQCV